ncbi:hypothetical protein RUM43_004950 [Polyplax serrata]|uniref:Uncharacterized protein n=1 Tax=Polyplax serrata TaxID=468196 RepID=A0AAN8SEL4_POLSC
MIIKIGWREKDDECEKGSDKVKNGILFNKTLMLRKKHDCSLTRHRLAKLEEDGRLMKLRQGSCGIKNSRTRKKGTRRSEMRRKVPNLSRTRIKKMKDLKNNKKMKRILSDKSSMIRKKVTIGCEVGQNQFQNWHLRYNLRVPLCAIDLQLQVDNSRLKEISQQNSRT